VLVLHTDLRNAGYAPDALRGVESELVVRLRALPGVRSASAAMVTPLDGVTWNNQVIVDGYERPDREDGLVYLNTVSDGYFMTVGTALVAGRDFDPRDREGAPLVAVINQTMALRFFGDLKPLGRRFRLDSAVTPTPEIEVVGVVENSKYESLSESDLPIAYFPLGQGELFGPTVTFIVRAAGFTAVIIPAIKAVMADAHPAISFDVATLSDQVAASLARPRLLAALSGFFGAVALLLAMIGLYGTLSNAVTSRRREIGVRLALGAAPIGVLRMVLGEVGRLVVVGIVLGVAATLASSRLLSAFLFGVTPNDPATLGMSAGALVGIALAAGALPALRAARLDPMAVLRED
jgi:predicted permease